MCVLKEACYVFMEGGGSPLLILSHCFLRADAYRLDTLIRIPAQMDVNSAGAQS